VLPSKHKILNSNPSTAKEGRKGRGGEGNEGKEGKKEGRRKNIGTFGPGSFWQWCLLTPFNFSF
jgi:hypothetical protein